MYRVCPLRLARPRVVRVPVLQRRAFASNKDSPAGDASEPVEPVEPVDGANVPTATDAAVAEDPDAEVEVRADVANILEVMDIKSSGTHKILRPYRKFEPFMDRREIMDKTQPGNQAMMARVARLEDLMDQDKKYIDTVDDKAKWMDAEYNQTKIPRIPPLQYDDLAHPTQFELEVARSVLDTRQAIIDNQLRGLTHRFENFVELNQRDVQLDDELFEDTDENDTRFKQIEEEAKAEMSDNEKKDYDELMAETQKVLEEKEVTRQADREREEDFSTDYDLFVMGSRADEKTRVDMLSDAGVKLTTREEALLEMTDAEGTFDEGTEYTGDEETAGDESGELEAADGTEETELATDDATVDTEDVEATEDGEKVEAADATEHGTDESEMAEVSDYDDDEGRTEGKKTRTDDFMLTTEQKQQLADLINSPEEPPLTKFQKSLFGNRFDDNADEVWVGKVLAPTRDGVKFANAHADVLLPLQAPEAKGFDPRARPALLDFSKPSQSELAAQLRSEPETQDQLAQTAGDELAEQTDMQEQFGTWLEDQTDAPGVELSALSPEDHAKWFSKFQTALADATSAVAETSDEEVAGAARHVITPEDDPRILEPGIDPRKDPALVKARIETMVNRPQAFQDGFSGRFLHMHRLEAVRDYFRLQKKELQYKKMFEYHDLSKLDLTIAPEDVHPDDVKKVPDFNRQMQEAYHQMLRQYRWTSPQKVEFLNLLRKTLITTPNRIRKMAAAGTGITGDPVRDSARITAIRRKFVKMTN